MLQKINKDGAVYKVLRAAAYVGISAALASLVSATEGNQALFGSATVIINVVLVALKSMVDARRA